LFAELDEQLARTLSAGAASAANDNAPDRSRGVSIERR
jgi:hypothetical protein